MCSVHQIVSFFHYSFFIFEIFQISPPYDTPYQINLLLKQYHQHQGQQQQQQQHNHYQQQQ